MDVELDVPISTSPAETPTDKSPRKNWWWRTFGTMQRGSQRGSVFTLLSVIIGIGCLSLPYNLKLCGLALGMGILFFNAGVAIVGLYNIAEAGDKYQVYHYPEIIRVMYGPRVGLATDLFFIVYFYTSLISCQVAFGEFVPGLAVSFDLDYDPYWATVVMQIGVLLVVILPLSLVRELTEIRYAATFSILSIFILVVVVTAEYAEGRRITNLCQFSHR